MRMHMSKGLFLIAHNPMNAEIKVGDEDASICGASCSGACMRF